MSNSWDLPEGFYKVGYDKGKNGDHAVRTWVKSQDGVGIVVCVETHQPEATLTQKVLEVLASKLSCFYNDPNLYSKDKYGIHRENLPEVARLIVEIVNGEKE